MTAAELTVKITADIHDLAAKLAEAGIELKAFGADAERASGRSTKAFDDTKNSLTRLDQASRDVRYSMNGRGPGLFGAIGEVTGGVLKLGSAVEKGAARLGDWMQQADQGGVAMTGFGTALSSVAPLLGYVSVGIAAIGVSLLGLPILAGLATFALTALADTIGTLGFVAYSALGPLGVLVGLLGLLAGGFVLSAEKAMKGKGVFHDFGGEVSRLGGMFQHLLTLLGVDFMPIFQRLVHVAQEAILYFDKLAKMPLADAFHSLATKGMSMLTQFLQHVGSALAQPFRLAVQLAFGGPGGSANSQIHGMLNQLGGYLFGTTGTAPMHRGSAHGAVVNQGSVPGALSPIRQWFDSLNVTKYGKKWGHEILQGLQESGITHGVAQWLLSVFEDAAKQAGKAFLRVLLSELMSGLPRLEQWIVTEIGKAFVALGLKARSWENELANGIQSNVGSAWDWVKQKVDGVWQTISSKAQAIWNHIVSFIERPMSVSISWPSPPGWVSSLLGKGLSLGSGITGFLAHHAAAGGIFTRPTNVLLGESGAEAVIPLTGAHGRNALGAMGGGGGGVTVVVTGNTFMSGGRPAARELARILKPELDRIVRAR